MLNNRQLLATASFVLLARALPAADPNDDSFECLSSWHAYDSSSNAYNQDPEYTTEIVSTTEYFVVNTEKDVPITTLCDGRARALRARSTTSIWTTKTLDPPQTSSEYFQYTGAAPTCTIAETACTAIQSSYSSALSDYSTNDAPYPTDEPHCMTHTPCSAGGLGSCYIYAEGVRNLYYWPVTTVSGDFCAQNGSTIFAEPTSPPEPNKVVIDGHTLTSPTNYLSFGGVSGVIHGAKYHTTQCGPPAHRDVLLPITEDLYSNANGNSRSTYSFNFADLNTVPADAYNRQQKCRSAGACARRTIEDYTPNIILPTQFRDLEDEWRTVECRGLPSGVGVFAVPLVTPAPEVSNRSV